MLLNITKHFKKKLNLPSKYLSEHMIFPSGNSKYEVERHRTCRENEALTDKCLSVPHVCKQSFRARHGILFCTAILLEILDCFFETFRMTLRSKTPNRRRIRSDRTSKKLSFVMFTHKMSNYLLFR